MTQQSDWLKRFHNARNEALVEAQDLLNLAGAFERTGNSLVAEEIRYAANRVQSLVEDMESAVGQHINEAYTQAMHGMALENFGIRPEEAEEYVKENG